MIDYGNVSLLDLLPPNLKTDADAIAAAAAIDERFRVFYDHTFKEIVFANIDGIADESLDVLAADLRVNLYDPALPVEQKRELIRNSIAVYAKKGTPWSLEQALKGAFGDVRIEEWFEYGGEPYYFKVFVRNENGGPGYSEKLVKAIEASKNVRSWIDEIIVYSETSMQTTLTATPAAPITIMTTRLPDEQPPVYAARVETFARTANVTQTRPPTLDDAEPAYVRDEETGELNELYVSDGEGGAKRVYIKLR